MAVNRNGGVYMENDRQKAMKGIMIKMSLLMGVTLSFFLSLTGLLASGHFTVPGFIVSFLASTVISLVIGFLIPVKKLGDKAAGKMKRGFGRACVESLVSDLIYTPVITLCMTGLAYMKIEGDKPPYIMMFLKSLGLSMVVGFVLIMIFMPLYLKLLLKGKMPGGRPGGPGGPEGGPEDRTI